MCNENDNMKIDNRDFELCLFEQTQSIAKIGHWSWNCINDEIVVSDELCKIFAIEKYKKWADFKNAIIKKIFQDDIDIIKKRFDIIENKLEMSPVEYRIVCSDGTIKYLRTHSVYYTYDQKGSCIRVSSVVQDITEQKNVESNQEKFLREINKAQKLDSLGVLASGIAHDFNNLLSGIFGYIEMALDVTKSKSATDSLTKAMQTIDRARIITQQLSTFTLENAPVKNQENIIRVVKDTVQFTLSGSNVTSKFEIGNENLICNIDKNQIAQAVSNIIMNAQQAMSFSGCIEISINSQNIAERAIAELPGGRYVKITIKDSGIGIPSGMLDKVFDPFFTTKSKGRGLGLTICYSIIKKHNGYITVSSMPGSGSTFNVFLPLVSSGCDDRNYVPRSAHHGKGKFFILDDEPVVRETLSLMIKSFGYSVEVFTDGRDILRILKNEHDFTAYGGILADLIIPGGIGGNELLKDLKSMSIDIPVFVISGYPDDPAIANPALYGFKGSICKPFTRSELSEMLDKKTCG